MSNAARQGWRYRGRSFTCWSVPSNRCKLARALCRHPEHLPAETPSTRLLLLLPPLLLGTSRPALPPKCTSQTCTHAPRHGPASHVPCLRTPHHALSVIRSAHAHSPMRPQPSVPRPAPRPRAHAPCTPGHLPALWAACGAQGVLPEPRAQQRAAHGTWVDWRGRCCLTEAARTPDRLCAKPH